MKRRIIKLGQATYVASLPSKWIRKHNLEKGDYLEVKEKDNSLIVSTEKLLDTKSIEIAVPKEDLFLKRYILAPYKFGYDEVKFTYKDKSLFSQIQLAADYLMGFEIVEQGDNYCVFRAISRTFQDEFDNLFRRVMTIISNNINEVIEILNTKDYKSLTKIPNQDKLVDKITLFLERAINKKGLNNFEKNALSYITIWSLEQIGDDIKNISQVILKLNLCSLETSKKIADVRNLFNEFLKLYYKPSLEKNFELNSKFIRTEQSLVKLIQKVPKEEVIIIHYLLKMVDKLNHLAVSIQADPELL